MKINDIINQFGEPTYFTPMEVWAEIYQPDAKDAMGNPPYVE